MPNCVHAVVDDGWLASLPSNASNVSLTHGSGSGYLKSVCDYVDLNPARAKLVTADQPLKRFAWTPDSESGLAPSQRPAGAGAWVAARFA